MNQNPGDDKAHHDMVKAHYDMLRRKKTFGAIHEALPPPYPFAQMPPVVNHQGNRPYSLGEMMAARMRWGAGDGNWAPGFAHMAIHSVGDKVHIWIITKDGQSIVLKDDEPLYPSDAIITKLRLLQQGG